MKATDLLEKQHREVETLLKQLSKEDLEKECENLLIEIADNLAAHMDIEQHIFYPTVKNLSEDIINEAYEEHSLAEYELKRLLSTNPTDAAFKARITALTQLLKHHIQEEENLLFPKVESFLEKSQLEELGALMKERFQNSLTQGYENLLSNNLLVSTSDLTRQEQTKVASNMRSSRKNLASEIENSTTF